MKDIGLLSSRQREVAELIADSCTDKDIECRLGLSNSGVRSHINAIADRLELDRARNIRVQIAFLVISQEYRQRA